MSFDTFAAGIIEGGTLTDADVNEVVRTPWYARALAWLLEVFADGD